MKKKLFFGWTNTKWFIKELIKTLSNEESYFSQKRIQTFVAFMSAEIGLNAYLFHNHNTLGMGDVLLWASLQFTIAGYVLSQTQKEKKAENENEINALPKPEIQQ